MVLKGSFYSNTACFNVPSLVHASLLSFKKKEQKIIPSTASPLLSILFYFINFEATHFQSLGASSLIL